MVWLLIVKYCLGLFVCMCDLMLVVGIMVIIVGVVICYFFFEGKIW